MKLNYYIYSLIASMMLFFSACSPEEFDLGTKSVESGDLAEGLAFTITKDADNPNIVYLKSLMPDSYTILWEHPQGRSQAKDVTLKIAFEGTYDVKFGVETRGGVVFGTPSSFTIDDFCADFVKGEMWEFLAGGAGGTKTWVPDTGNYGMKQGFYSCFDPTTTYADMTSDNGFNWFPKDKTWWEPKNSEAGITEDDLNSYMTFSLAGKAGLTVHRITDGQEVVTEGLFSMNADNHTMSAIDADFLHGAWADGKAVDFRNGFQILVLTENQLMIGNYRDEALSGEGRCVYSWNFVSKEYADNYVPEDVPDPEPTLPDGWKDEIEQNAVVTTKIDWRFSDKNPLDWAKLDGSLMNDFKVPGDYPDWLGTPDPASYAAFSLVLESSDHTYVCTTPDGTSVSGEYTLDEKGIYTFSNGLPSCAIVGWASFATTSENQLRILQIEKDALGKVSGMWLGARDPAKDEYTAFHLIAKAESAGPVDPLAAWKKALCGKTFVPDVNYFADWVDGAWAGGWTASTFPDDFTTNGWLWTQDVYNACKASSITFYADGDDIKADAVDNGTAKNGIAVTIDPDAATITYSEVPFTFSFVYTDNNGGKGPWLFGSYDGANLGNTATKGIYTGFVSKEGEITMNHMVLKTD